MAFSPFGKKAPNQMEQERRREIEASRVYQEGLASIKDIIAPAAVEITFNHIKLGNFYARTLFTYTYPRYIYTNWLSPVINFDNTLDVVQYIYPVESQIVLKNLRNRVAQMQSVYSERQSKGLIRDPSLEAAYSDAEEMRDRIQAGEERFFQFGLYFTLYAESIEDLDALTKKLETTLGGKLVYTKPANLQVEQGFNSTLPLGMDQLLITRNMNTTALSTTFPFTSSELTSGRGILYGINRHNNGLILFDRFELENANSVVFAKSGAGKSYAVKIEALRHLMIGTDIIIIDPENEYEPLCRAIGGSYLNVSLNSTERINPFDLPQEEGEEAKDALRTNIIMLHGLLRLMMGQLSVEEDNVLDRAIAETYARAGISADPKTHNLAAPTMGDLQTVLSSMQGGASMSLRLGKYTEGTFSGIFNQPSNVDLNNRFIVFNIRDLEEALRPIAMYVILNFVWNRVKSRLKKRILIVDEAWYMMKYEDSAQFLYSVAKRARKYYLGLTVVTQDVEDVLDSKYGKAVVNNSSIQILLKQSPAAIDLVKKTFNLTEGEKYLLLESDVGEGLFFVGLNHVAVKIIASYAEDQLITTDPKQVLQQQSDAASRAQTQEQPTTGGA
jgi:type IV secretory pathway VirB4 component